MTYDSQFILGAVMDLFDEEGVSERVTTEATEAILEHADLRVLLMCLVHITGDMSWLGSRFRPLRDTRLNFTL